MVFSEVCEFRKDFIVSGMFHVEIQSNSKKECAQKALEVHGEHLNATGVNWREDGNGKWCSAEFGKIWQKRIISDSGAFGCLFGGIIIVFIHIAQLKTCLNQVFLPL